MSNFSVQQQQQPQARPGNVPLSSSRPGNNKLGELRLLCMAIFPVCPWANSLFAIVLSVCSNRIKLGLRCPCWRRSAWVTKQSTKGCECHEYICSKLGCFPAHDSFGFVVSCPHFVVVSHLLLLCTHHLSSKHQTSRHTSATSFLLCHLYLPTAERAGAQLAEPFNHGGGRRRKHQRWTDV